MRVRGIFLIVLAGVCIVGAAEITGELKMWHKVTLDFEGPACTETGDPNPSMDYRLNVTFSNPNHDRTYVVPGYFAADGDAANTSAESGNIWRVHFAPDTTGTWSYAVSFREGTDVAVAEEVDAGSSGGYMDGETGTFDISPSDKTGRDHRAKGRLDYVGEHHLRYAGTGEYFIKGGFDSPENFLAYDDFDNTTDVHGWRKSWDAHVADWNEGDPTWNGDMGKGLIGALNYLASKGCNVFSFLTFNVGGDDDNVFPYTSPNEKFRMDVSKLDQWEVIFEHADKLGLFMHFKTLETEVMFYHDNGQTGPERKIYYRTLIARFGHHLALNWNLGEESTQDLELRVAMADYFYTHDPYQHIVVIHNAGNKFEDMMGDVSKVRGWSMQIPPNTVHQHTVEWREMSAAAGVPWVISSDEQQIGSGLVPDADDYWHDSFRDEVLWGNLMGGGGGVEYYFGWDYAEDDLRNEDWRTRDHMLEMTAMALQFFREHLPFGTMVPGDDLTADDNDYVYYLDGEVYCVYLRNGGSVDLDLSGVSGSFDVDWFDPRNGGALQSGTVTTVEGGGTVNLGNPPDSPTEDWVVLVKDPNITGSRKPAATDAGGALRCVNMIHHAGGRKLFFTSTETGPFHLKLYNSRGEVVAVREGLESQQAVTVKNCSNGYYVAEIISLTTGIRFRQNVIFMY